MTIIYCLMHARNERSNSKVVKAYNNEDSCVQDLHILLSSLSAIRIRKKVDVNANRFHIDEARKAFEKHHPEFDFNLGRTMNDKYWIEEVELV